MSRQFGWSFIHLTQKRSWYLVLKGKYIFPKRKSDLPDINSGMSLLNLSKQNLSTELIFHTQLTYIQEQICSHTSSHSVRLYPFSSRLNGIHNCIQKYDYCINIRLHLFQFKYHRKPIQLLKVDGELQDVATYDPVLDNCQFCHCYTIIRHKKGEFLQLFYNF